MQCPVMSLIVSMTWMEDKKLGGLLHWTPLFSFTMYYCSNRVSMTWVTLLRWAYLLRILDAVARRTADLMQGQKSKKNWTVMLVCNLEYRIPNDLQAKGTHGNHRAQELQEGLVRDHLVESLVLPFLARGADPPNETAEEHICRLDALSNDVSQQNCAREEMHTLDTDDLIALLSNVQRGDQQVYIKVLGHNVRAQVLA